MTTAAFHAHVVEAERLGIHYPRAYVYKAYIQSNAWKVFRASVIAAADERCQRCGDYADRLEIHHLHYDTIGQENLSDVLVVCPPCHAVVDPQRTKGKRLIYPTRIELQADPSGLFD